MLRAQTMDARNLAAADLYGPFASPSVPLSFRACLSSLNAPRTIHPSPKTPSTRSRRFRIGWFVRTCASTET